MHRLRGGRALIDGSTDPDRRFVRDRTTWLIYGLVGIYGYFLYAFGPSGSLLRSDEHTSRTVSGLHGTGLALGAITAGVLGPRLIARFGRRRILQLGCVGLALGIGVYCAWHIVAVTLVGAWIAGSFGALIINIHGAALTDHHGAHSAAAVTEANGVGAGLGLLAPVMLGIFAAVGPSQSWWRGGMLLLVPFCVVLAVVLRGEDVGSGAALPVEHATGVRLPRLFWFAWGALVACIGLEFVMTFWASELLRSRSGMSESGATAAISAVVLGLALGRFFGSRLALRFVPDRVLLAALAVDLAGFVIFWVSAVAWLSILALFVVGLGLAMQYPLAVVRALAASGGRPDVGAARLSLGSGLAIGLAPFALGFLADRIGTHSAYLLVPVLVAAAVSLVLLGPAPRAASPVTH